MNWVMANRLPQAWALPQVHSLAMVIIDCLQALKPSYPKQLQSSLIDWLLHHVHYGNSPSHLPRAGLWLSKRYFLRLADLTFG
jgi:hypothetical protein